MTAVLVEWLNVLLRWAHVMFGILWIGTSFFFVWLDASLRRRPGGDPTIAGESWMVHGGGFYLAEKYTVAPERLPPELHWFKYEAYFTLITGLLLLASVYYLNAEGFLIDRAKTSIDPAMAVILSAGSLAAGWFIYDALCKSAIGVSTPKLATAVFAEIAAFAFFFHAVFSDRAAFLHVGALIGTIMATSVFAVIIPNQKKVVADLLAGRRPDPALGKQARQRSLHNNYLTLPVIFMMISNHYPIIFGHPRAPFVALGIIVGGALVRHYFNSADAGKIDWSARWAIPAAGVVLVAMVALTAERPAATVAAGGAPVRFADIQPIVAEHCVACHAARPTNPDFPQAPKGVMLDTPDGIASHAAQVRQQAVLARIMPLGNMTGMTESERGRLGAWIEAGAKLD